MANIDKSTFFLSFFNSRVYPEVKSNIRYFEIYNREALADNKANKTILDIIDKNIITDVNESLIRTRFKTEGFIDAEIDPMMEHIIDFKLGDSSANKVIDEVLDYVRKAVHKTFFDKALREYKTDPIALVEEIQSFHYIGKAKDKVPFTKFSKINIDDISAKEMKLLFKTGLNVIDNSNALGGIVTGKLYQVVGPPSAGKSLLMQYLAVKACQNKIKTALIILGDLDYVALMIRLYSLANDIPLKDATLDQRAAYDFVSKSYIDQYLNICVLPAKEASIDEVVEAVRDLDAEFVEIDYDTNLKTLAGSMYEEGDLTYAAATKLTIGDGRTVVVGSQPKTCYWNNDFLDLLSANESSRKQHHVRVMITIGRHLNPGGNPAGYITLPKNEIGDNTQTPYLRSSSGLFVEVDPVTYAAYADTKVPRILDTAEILDEIKLNTSEEYKDSKTKSKTDVAKKIEENDNLTNFVNSIPDAK